MKLGPISATAFAILLATANPSISPAAEPKLNGGRQAPLIAFQQAFSGKLYTAAAEEDRRGNFVLAPYSAFESLAILQTGAEGTTRETIQRVAGIPRPTDDIAATFRAFRRLGSKQGYRFPAFVGNNKGYGVKLIDGPPPGSPAAESGLSQGDLIFAVDGLPVRSEDDFLKACATSPGVISVDAYDFSTGLLLRNRQVRLTPAVIRGGGAAPLVNASAIWLQRSLAAQSFFPTRIGELFDTRVFATDFGDNELLKLQASEYFSRATSDRISAISPPEINEQTRFLLIQACAMDAKWKFPFDRTSTFVDRFVTPEKIVQTRYMAAARPARFAKLEGYRVLELPLADGKLVMRFFLPDQAADWSIIESKWLAPAELRKMTEALAMRNVDIQIPRFRVDTTGSLRSKYKQIGLGNLFSNDADFRGISGDKSLKLADVRQEAFLEINEEGVRAGAVTQSIGVVKSVPSQEIESFHAKHPFLFQVLDGSGPIFFAGRVTTPQIAAEP